MTLSYLQEASLYDFNGRCRCPCCGKFRKRSDFTDQDAVIVIGDTRLSVDPACNACLGRDGE